MKIHSIYYERYLLVLVFLLNQFACSEIPATNPYDPKTPISQQATGKIVGKIQLLTPSGLSNTSYQLIIKKKNEGFILDENGQKKTWQTRKKEDVVPSDLKDVENALGTFEIELNSGTYEVLFDQDVNQTPALISTSSGLIEVKSGQSSIVLLNINLNIGKFECLSDFDCDDFEICEQGKCRIDTSKDDDRDGVPNGVDNCASLLNTTQDDHDRDGQGDACDIDDDNDGVLDDDDNCPKISGLDQNDSDHDGIGDLCDEEKLSAKIVGYLRFDNVEGGLGDYSYQIQLIDSNRHLIEDDNGQVKTWWTRLDGDRIPEDQNGAIGVSAKGSFEIKIPAGTYALVFNPILNNRSLLQNTQTAFFTLDNNQLVIKQDLSVSAMIVEEDACFDDRDCFFPLEVCDNETRKCVTNVNLDQDRDGVPDREDNCPLSANADQDNPDHDEFGNACDQDDDGDGVNDLVDNCPVVINIDQLDLDIDGVGNACDPDYVGEPLIANTVDTLAPLGEGSIDIVGGIPPYQYEFVSNPPKTGIDAFLNLNGTFKLGSKGDVVEQIRITDSLGVFVDININVSYKLSLTPSVSVINTNSPVSIIPTGGNTSVPYRYEIINSRNDGARYDAQNKLFYAGTTPNAEYSLSVFDSNGSVATSTIKTTSSTDVSTGDLFIISHDLNNDGIKENYILNENNFISELKINYDKTFQIIPIEFDDQQYYEVKTFFEIEINQKKYFVFQSKIGQRIYIISLNNGKFHIEQTITSTSNDALVSRSFARIALDSSLYSQSRNHYYLPLYSIVQKKLKIYKLSIENDVINYDVVLVYNLSLQDTSLAITKLFFHELEDGNFALLVEYYSLLIPKFRKFYINLINFSELEYCENHNCSEKNLDFLQEQASNISIDKTASLIQAFKENPNKVSYILLSGLTNELVILEYDKISNQLQFVTHERENGNGNYCSPCGLEVDVACINGYTCSDINLGSHCLKNCVDSLDCNILHGESCKTGVCYPALDVCPTSLYYNTGLNPRYTNFVNHQDNTKEIYISTINNLEVYNYDSNLKQMEKVFTYPTFDTNGPYTFTLYDYDNDGLKDIIVKNRNKNSISILDNYTLQYKQNLTGIINNTSLFLGLIGNKYPLITISDYLNLNVYEYINKQWILLQNLSTSDNSIPIIPKNISSNDRSYLMINKPVEQLSNLYIWNDDLKHFEGYDQFISRLQTQQYLLFDFNLDGFLDIIAYNEIDHDISLHLNQMGSIENLGSLIISEQKTPAPNSLFTLTSGETIAAISLQQTSNFNNFILQTNSANSKNIKFFQLNTENQTINSIMNDINFVTYRNQGYYGDVSSFLLLDCDDDIDAEMLFLTTPLNEDNFNKAEQFLIYDLQNNQMQRQWSGNLTNGSMISTIQPNQDPRCTGNNWPNDDICSWYNTYINQSISIIRSADVDKDGENELLIVDSISRNKIQIFKNQGQCIFKPWRQASILENVSNLTVLDLDNKGENEILALSTQGQLIELFHQDQTEYQFNLHKKMCEFCESDSDCGSNDDLCVIQKGSMFQCSVSCNEGEQCPQGFECRYVEDRQSKQCFPTMNRDCIPQ